MTRGGTGPAPEYDPDASGSAGSSGALGHITEFDIILFGIQTVARAFAAATSPPRDAQSNELNTPPLSIPSHLYGGNLGRAAANTPGVRSAFPSTAPGPDAAASLSPAVPHQLDAPLVDDAPSRQHVEQYTENNVAEARTGAADTGDYLGGTLGLGPPTGDDPRNFEQSGRQPALPSRLRPGVHRSRPREGDPVDPGTGELLVDHDDIDVPGVGLDFVLSRHYRSSSRYIGALGFGWAMSFEQYLVRSGLRCRLTGGPTQDVIDWYTGHGVAIRFRQNTSTGRWVAEGGVDHTLTRHGGQWWVTSPDGIVTVFSDTIRIDPQDGALAIGVPLEIRDRNNNKLRISAGMRSGSRVTSSPIELYVIEDTVGRQFVFEYDSRGYLSAVRGPTMAASYVVDARGDLTSATNAEGVLETYEYDHDPQRASVPNRYPSAQLAYRCDAECGSLGFCGACSGVHQAQVAACESRCRDTESCTDGKGTSPSCSETCDAPCRPSSDAASRCQSLCSTGTYQLPVSSCEALRPLAFGSALSLERGCEYGSTPGLPWCSVVVSFDAYSSDPTAVKPTGCCPADTQRQRLAFEACRASPPMVHAPAVASANEAACAAAAPAIRSQCDLVCPSTRSCAEACIADGVCSRYVQQSTQGSLGFPPNEYTVVGATIYYPVHTWVYSESLRGRSCPHIITTEDPAALCAVSWNNAATPTYHPFWTLHPHEVAAVNLSSGHYCENPTQDARKWEWSYDGCPSSCMECMGYCEREGGEQCELEMAAARMPACEQACDTYLGAACRSDCTSSCQAACAEPSSCQASCATADFGAVCTAECRSSCVARNSETDASGKVLARFGNPTDLDHNLVRIRDGEGRLFLTNVYETDHRKSTFDRVTRQTFGDEITTFRTYALGSEALNVAPEDVGLVEAQPQAVELCASSCTESLADLGDGERWVSVVGGMGGDYLAFDRSTPASWPVGVADDSGDWGVLPVFGWYEVEHVGGTQGLIRPAVPLPAAGLRVDGPSGPLLLTQGIEGNVKIMGATNGLFVSQRLSLVRSAAGWRAVPGVVRAAVQASPPEACGPEFLVVRDASGAVALAEGQCTGVVRVREIGRPNSQMWRPTLSSVRGTKTWSFTTDTEGRRMGRVIAWSTAGDPWSDLGIGCLPAQRLDRPEEMCERAVRGWPGHTPLPDCGVPWPVRGGGGGARPPLGGPSADCWPDASPVHVEGHQPTSCVERSSFKGARDAPLHVQPFGWGTVVRRADGSSTTYYSSVEGQLLRVVDNNHAARVDYNYDDRQRLIGVRDVHGARTCIQYDERSNPLRTVDLPSPGRPASQSQLEEWVAFAAYGQPSAIYDAGPNGSQARLLMSYEYDARGNLRFSRRMRASGILTDEYVMDARGRVTDVYGADGAARHVDYSSVTGTPVSIIDYERVGLATYSPGVPALSRVTITPDPQGRPMRVESVGGARAGPVSEDVLGPSGLLRERRLWSDPGRQFTPAVSIYTRDRSGLVTGIETNRTTSQLAWTLQGFLRTVTRESKPGPQSSGSRERVCAQYLNGVLKSRIDGDGRITRRVWTPSNPTRVDLEQGIGPLEEWAIDCADNLVDQVTDGFEVVSRSAVAADGRLLAAVEAPTSVGPDRADTTVHLDYDGFGRLIRRRHASGAVERWGYDGFDRTVWEAVFSPVPGTTLPSVGALEDAAPSTALGTLDPTLASYVAYDYDDDHRVTQRRTLWFTREPSLVMLGSDGWQRETWEYLDAARMMAATDGNGETTWEHYDALGRVDRVMLADGVTVVARYEYRDGGQTVVVRITDGSVPSGERVETHRFTPWGALEAIEDAQGRSLWLGYYDELGALRYEYGPLEGFEYRYDDFGRRVSTSRRVSMGVFEPFESLGYSAAGRLLTYADAAQRKTHWRRDRLGRVHETRLPSGGAEGTSYFAGTGLPRLSTHRGGESTSYAYDAFGQVARTVSRRGTSVSETTMVRDVWGLREARTWNARGAGPRTDEVSVGFDWDSSGQLRVERASSWPTPVIYGRDGTGRWTELDLGPTQLTRSFTTWGRLDSVGVAPGRTLADYAYPPGVSASTSVTYANGVVETRGYDDRGRLSSSAARLGQTLRFQQSWVWGPDENLARWDAADAAGRRSFLFRADNRGRLAEAGVHTSLSAPASGRATAAELNAWLQGAAGRETYVVDATDRLTEKTNSNGAQHPSYGADGELMKWDGLVVGNDVHGRPTHMDGTSLEYDAAGRLIASVASNGDRTKYLYDPLGRLVGWDGPAGVSSRFRYADGQIVEEREATKHRVLVPGEGLVPVAIVSGGTEHTNLWGPGDRLVAALDASGALAERYESFGHAAPVILSAAGAPLSVSGVGNRMLLGGQPWVPELGAYRQGHRWYRPAWGRFMTPDPLGYVDGPNVYAYGGMNPARWTDPLGLRRGQAGGSGVEVPYARGSAARFCAGGGRPGARGRGAAVPTPPRDERYPGERAQLQREIRDILPQLSPEARRTFEHPQIGTPSTSSLRSQASAARDLARLEAYGRLNPLEREVANIPVGLLPPVAAARVPAGAGAGPGAGAREPAVNAAKGSVAAEMRPYGGPGGGHHVPAKRAFEGAPRYDKNAALAVPNAEMARLGVYHPDVTAAQMSGYRAFARTGSNLTWTDVARIETAALVRGGMTRDMAAATVRQGIEALQQAGVPGPTRIPWGNR